MLKLAILDLYDNVPNEGMKCIIDIAEQFKEEVVWTKFDVRGKAEVPNIEDFDCFISSGGPGSPLEGDGVWDKRIFEFFDTVWHHNLTSEDKKPLFLICYSFQLACHFFELGMVNRRKSISFGIFPIYPTTEAIDDPLLNGLPNPIWGTDNRNFQVVQPNLERFSEMGASIVALEKPRPHVPLERAMMAIRFSPEIFGTQFHPEAAPERMMPYFSQEEMKLTIIKNHGSVKYNQMMKDLKDKTKVELTHNTILPNFIKEAITKKKHIQQHIKNEM